MRKKIILSAIVIIFAHLTGMAQKENKRSFIAKGVEWVKGYLDATSKKGIDSVLNYTKHNYIYMCAKEDFSGTHNFAANYAEHMKNARKYWKALKERKIFN